MRAKHPNVLSIEGVDSNLFELCMISQWMDGGDVLHYLENFPGTNRLELVGPTRQRLEPPLTGLYY